MQNGKEGCKGSDDGVYNTKNYWVLDFVHHPVFYKLENTTFRKLDLFPPSGKGEGEELSSITVWYCRSLTLYDEPELSVSLP
jgi:hypothetical protein